MGSNVMNGASAGRWDGTERRSAWKCREWAALGSEDRESAELKLSPVVDAFGTVIAMGFGVSVFYATGLAESEAGWFRSLLGFATVFWMVCMVRFGLSRQ